MAAARVLRSVQGSCIGARKRQNVQNEYVFGAENGSLGAKKEVRICAASPMKLDK